MCAERAGLQPAQVPEASIQADYPLALELLVVGDLGSAEIDCPTHRFTRERTVAIWVGNFDGRPMERVRGRVGAAPLLRQVAHLVYPRAASPGDVPWYEPPPSLVLRTVCATTGRPPSRKVLLTPRTSRQGVELFIADQPHP